ncbi:phage terminase large subunit family protein [Aureimonas pseudogalii]|uniref:Phage terminase large subunit GpA-like protein n=1 Tax=Aureimonas pseudogalii TaxID=1744844 RepID=A0A7W6H2Q2_9HYPH|nr:terminase gpA endonuclease subunit [Aureimonas pseudogalii]MBB3996890.1 phage terminase large subunit GpA-like protein [Aureimonas pseudogalii]
MTQLVVQTANAQRVAEEVLAEIWSPPPPVDYLAWAIDNIVFSEQESKFHGPYNPTLFPYFSEILRALSPDDPCRIVTLRKSAQIGGTVLANVFTGGSVDMDPGSFMFVHPTADNAVRWSRMKLAPMLRGTASLAAMFPMRSRDGSDSVLYKERADGRGSILISGANSPASLSQVTMKRQVQDDLSKWEMNLAGDPETQANSRSRGRSDAKIFKISTPLIDPGCRISASFDDGSQEEFYIPCPHCEHMQALEWENMLAVLDEAQPEVAHFTCVECGCEIHEHHRGAILPRGEWRANNPGARRYHRSFDLWSAYSHLQPFEQIAREYLAAKGVPSKEQVFFNDTVGRAYKTLGEAPPWETLRDRGAVSFYQRGSIPAGGLLLTMGIDCQGDRVEWQAVVWGRDYRRWIVDAGVIQGHISEERCQTRLNALIEQRWGNAAGNKIKPDRVAIDGNAYTEDVWSWVKGKPSSQVIMVRGVGSETAPLIAMVKKEKSRTGKTLRYSKRFYNFATSVLKMGLYRNIVRDDPLARGFVGLPTGMEDEFYRQLTSESRRAKQNKLGFTVYEWVKEPTVPNEMLDAHLQAEAAAIHYGIRGMPDAIWDRLEAERDTPAKDQQFDFEDGLFALPPAAVPQETPVTDLQTAAQPVAKLTPPSRPRWRGYS